VGTGHLVDGHKEHPAGRAEIASTANAKTHLTIPRGPIVTRDCGLDRTDLPPLSTAGATRTIDPHRVRSSHEPAPTQAARTTVTDSRRMRIVPQGVLSTAGSIGGGSPTWHVAALLPAAGRRGRTRAAPSAVPSRINPQEPVSLWAMNQVLAVRQPSNRQRAWSRDVGTGTSAPQTRRAGPRGRGASSGEYPTPRTRSRCGRPRRCDESPRSPRSRRRHYGTPTSASRCSRGEAAVDSERLPRRNRGRPSRPRVVAAHT